MQQTKLPWFSRLYDIRPRNKAGLFYNAPEPKSGEWQSSTSHTEYKIQLEHTWCYAKFPSVIIQYTVKIAKCYDENSKCNTWKKTDT